MADSAAIALSIEAVCASNVVARLIAGELNTRQILTARVIDAAVRGLVP